MSDSPTQSASTTQPLTAEALAHHLETILAQHWGHPVKLAQCELLTAGASAITWRVSAQHDQGYDELIVKLDSGVAPFSFQIGKRAEALIQQRAWQVGVPTPEVLVVMEAHPSLGTGYVMRRLPGISLGNRILRDPTLSGARERLVVDCAQALASLHTIAPSPELSGIPCLDARTQLDQLYALHRQYGDPLPVFALAHRWLQDHQPDPLPHRLVHGDFRLGNLLVSAQGLQGVLDWELAHWGDPREDLGWLCIRPWRFQSPQRTVGGFADTTALVQAYQQASGIPVNETELHYWQVLGTFKWGVICQYQAHRHPTDHPALEHAAIGRRIAETEHDLLVLLSRTEANACR